MATATATAVVAMHEHTKKTGKKHSNNGET